MQTFLPYPDFAASAAVLDFRRLGKQRLEADQILKTLVRGGGWANHPAVRMWRGYEPALISYRDAVIAEWVRRGYRNSMPFLSDAGRAGGFVLPWWLGMERFHASHRSNLLRKDRAHYRRFGWTEPDDMDYFWPVSDFRPAEGF